MRYGDGQEVRLWDRVETWPGCRGIVVMSIDTEEFTPEFPREEWLYLGSGVMIDTEQTGLLHLSEAEPELVLVSRGGPPTPAELAALRDAQSRHRASGGGR